MQFVTLYRFRNQSEETAGRLLQVFAVWSPPEGLEVVSQLAFADGSGGLLISEAESAEAIVKATSVFAPYMDLEAHPVVDVQVAVAAQAEAMQFRAGLS